MKVLYISGMYPNPTYPQKGIFCHEQVKALKKVGVEVDVLVPMTIYDKEYTTKIWEYEGVTIRYIRYIKHPGVRFFEHIGKALYLSLVCSGIDFKQYDVLHADAPLPAGDAVMRLSRKYNIPYVVHGHGLDVFMDVDYAGTKNCQQIVSKCNQVYLDANGIVGVSQKVIDNINEKLDLRSKCYVVYNGVDPNKFFPNDSKDNKTLKIVSVGNIIDLKGHDLTIQAVNTLIKEYGLELSLDIYGRGNNFSKLQELIEKLGIEKYVFLKGYIPYEELASVLRTYDMFILPSWYEALGCVYLEAMASGLVTVGCYENGIDEIIKHGINGYLVRPHNTGDIVEIIDTVSKHFLSPSMKQLVCVGRKDISENYTWEKSAERLKYVYTTLLPQFK